MKATFKNILVGIPSEKELGDLGGIKIPEGFVSVDHLHITLLSSELSKEARKDLKGKDLSSIPSFPSVSFLEPYVAHNGVKGSIVVDCVEQSAIKEWVEGIVEQLGIDCKINPERVYHLSIANFTGSQFDSVPDPWNHKQ